MLIVEKCKEKKEKLHLSYAQISELSGIPLSTVNTFFTGSVQNPSFITVGAICKSLGVSVDSTLGIVDPEMSATEIERVRNESQKNESILRETVRKHAQDIMLQKATIQNDQEIIRRQDLRMDALNDRIAKQCTAIIIHRVLIFSLASWAIIATYFLMV